MNTFNGRRAPNVSQYVANLNTIPSAHDMATQQQDDFSLEDDLALFTNTEFYDFDLGENIQQAPTGDYDPTLEERAIRGQVGAHKDNAKNLDFVNGTLEEHIGGASAYYIVFAIAISVAGARLWLPSPCLHDASTTFFSLHFPTILSLAHTQKSTSHDQTFETKLTSFPQQQTSNSPP